MIRTASKNPAFACGVVLCTAVACGEIDASPGNPSEVTGNTEQVTDPDGQYVTGKTGLGFGTQVGSEGFWGCLVTSATEVVATDMVPDGTLSVEKAVEQIGGAWALTYAPIAGEAVDGALWLDDATTYQQVETDGCGSYVIGEVTGVLTRDEQDVVVTGWMALAADASELRLVAPTAQANVREAWGDPATSDLTYLRLDAALDDSEGLVGTVAHADCLDATCEASKELALLAGSR